MRIEPRPSFFMSRVHPGDIQILKPETIVSVAETILKDPLSGALHVFDQFSNTHPSIEIFDKILIGASLGLKNTTEKF